MQAYLDNTPIIHDGNVHLYVGDAHVDGERKARGLVPRNYKAHPVGSIEGIKAVDFPLIPQADWDKWISEQIQAKSRNSDIRMIGNNGKPIPSTDQNGKGFCWAHSVTSAMMLIRALMGLPYVELSAYAIACILKNYRDEGAWGALAAKFAMERGIPSSQFWPIKSMSRSNDNAQTWANAAEHKMGETWFDVQAAVYDANLTFAQFVTGFLTNCVGVCDFSWWSHSVAGIDAVSGKSTWGRCRADSGKLLDVSGFDLVWGMNDPVTGGIGTKIWNSWSDTFGDLGTSVLTGRQAVPDGGLLVRTATVSK